MKCELIVFDDQNNLPKRMHSLRLFERKITSNGTKVTYFSMIILTWLLVIGVTFIWYHDAIATDIEFRFELIRLFISER
jgi:hypothetical protein